MIHEKIYKSKVRKMTRSNDQEQAKAKNNKNKN